jgi:hypothetical protein
MSEDTEKKLAAARAARAALQAEREKAIAAVSAEEALAAEERALRDETALFTAEKAHGKSGEKIGVLKGVGAKECDIVILKRPNPVAFKKFQALEAVGQTELEQLVAPCVVYPTIDVWDRIISNEQPGLLLRAAKAVSYLAGVREKDDLGKA